VILLAAIGTGVYFFVFREQPTSRESHAVTPEPEKTKPAEEEVISTPENTAETESTPTPEESMSAVESNIPTPPAPEETENDATPVFHYDCMVMSGVYYCADEVDSYLEFSLVGEQLSILKRNGTEVDIQTLIDAPDGPIFSVEYEGRRIAFFYSASGKSVTVTENGETALFSVDGNLFWSQATPAATDETDVEKITPEEIALLFDELPESSLNPLNDPMSYLLPSNIMYITRSDLEGMTREETVLARNEIYARYGYTFQSDDIRRYFESKQWYRAIPAVNADTFSTENMNSYERENLKVIQEYEKEMGWK